MRQVGHLLNLCYDARSANHKKKKTSKYYAVSRTVYFPQLSLYLSGVPTADDLSHFTKVVRSGARKGQAIVTSKDLQKLVNADTKEQRTNISASLSLS